jgi:hypothetical protein
MKRCYYLRSWRIFLHLSQYCVYFKSRSRRSIITPLHRMVGGLIIKCGGNMMRLLLSFVISFMLFSDVFAKENLGKIINIIGDVDVTSLTTGSRFTPQVGMIIQRDHKIRTGKKSFVEILLNNGTKIYLKEISVLNISSVRLSDMDQPTRLKMLTGKIRIIVKKVFKDRTLILKTPTTVAGVRGTDFGAIASKHETKVVVFTGRVEVANASKDIIKSYILNDREEVSVKENKPPTKPTVVPSEVLGSWFDLYEIDERNKIIIRREKDGGIIDKILRKREF